MFLRHPAFLACLLLAFAVGSTPFARADRYRVHGTMILDPNGHQFVAKGANINGYNSAWGGPTLGDLPLFKDVWRFNFARIYNRINPNYNGFNKNIQYLYDVIDAYTAAGIVVMPEVHDRTGNFFTATSAPSLDDLKAFWVDLANRYKHDSRVWFNLMNEPDSPGTTLATAQWDAMHREVIAAIRATGARNIIVLDGESFAQESGIFNNNPVRTQNSAFLTYGPALLDWHEQNWGDRNLVFGVHFYREWVWGDEKMIDFLDRCEAAGLALIVGEYGRFTNNPTMAATYSMGRVAFPRNIGRVAWHWVGGDQNDFTTSNNGGARWIDRTDGSKPTNLTDLGEFIWDDNHAPPLDTQPPWPATNLVLLERDERSLTVGWDPADDNFGVVAYDILVDDTLAATTAETHVELDGLTPAQSYVIVVRARDAAGNVSAPSEPLTAATYPLAVNLVANGDFEAPSPRPWRRINARVDNGDAVGGQASLLLGNPGVAAASAEQVVAGLEPGRPAILRAWVRLHEAGGRVEIEVVDPDGASASMGVSATEWTPVRLDFTPTGGAVRVRFATAAGSRVSASVDDVSVIQR